MKKVPVLHTEQYGSGPTVILLHGFLASSKYWKRVSDLVSKNHRVISIDLLGFGSSPKPFHSAYDYNAHIASISKTIDSLELKEQFVLIGHSMGALLALRYANQQPDKIKQLILTNMPVMLGKKEVKRQFFKSNIIFRLGLSPVTHHFMWRTLRVLYRTKWLPAQAINKLTTNIDYVFNHSAASRLRSFRNVIMDAKTDVDLATVIVRTTVLSGIDDKKVYIDNLLNKIQLSPSVVLQNVKTGHHIPLLMPELLVEKIRE